MAAAAAAAARPAGQPGAPGGDGDELYCICHGRDNGLFMYQCDGCGEWYHGDCTGLSEYEVEHKAADEVVLCPDCCAERVPLSDLEMVQRRVLRGELVPGARGIVIKKIDVHADRTDAERRARFTALLADALCGCDAACDRDQRATARLRAEDVERVLYATAHGDAASASYRLRARSVRIAVCESAVLRARVLRGECTPEALAAAEPTALSVAENAAARRRLEEQIRRAAGDTAPGTASTPAQGNPTFPARSAHAGAGDSADPRAFLRQATSSSSSCSSFISSAAAEGEENGSSSVGGAEGLARKRTRLASADVVWDGVVERNDKSTHGPCRVTGQHVSGAPGLHRLVPAHVVFAGRFDLAKLLAYLHDLEHSTSRRRAALLLAPRDTQDAIHYNAMYDHFTDKHRAGFLKPAPVPSSSTSSSSDSDSAAPASAQAPAPAAPVAEELYMVPLERGAALPQFLCSDPFTNREALAAEATHPRLLLVAVARVSTIEAEHAQHSHTPAAP